MKVVYNKVFPFKGFYAVTILWFIFIRKEFKRWDSMSVHYKMLRHEGIHEAQILDFTPSCFNYYVRMILGALPFYLIYVFNWLVLLPKYKKEAYDNISFEKEAYSNEHNSNYIMTRKRFAQWRK